MSAQLAAHGYPTLDLAYFAEPGLPGHLANIPLEYFAKALTLLRGEPGVDPKHVVVMGVSVEMKQRWSSARRTRA